MGRRKRERKQARARLTRRLFVLPFLLVCAAFAWMGIRTLLPGWGLFGILWAAGALGVVGFAAYGLARKIREDDAAESEPPDTPPESGPDEADAILGTRKREQAAAEKQRRAEAKERLRQLRAMHELRAVSDEEYERMRWEILNGG